MKTHLNILSFPQTEQQSINFSIFTKLFDTSYPRNLTLSMLLISLIIFLIKLHKTFICEFILRKIFGTNEEKIEKNLSFDEFTINKFMNFENVKAHLFYKEDSYFKQKYGSDFNPEFYDMVLLKHEVLEILRKESDQMLKKIIVEKIKNSNSLKIVFALKLISFLICFVFFACAAMLLKFLFCELGFVKSLILFCLPVAFVFALFLSLSFIIGAEAFKGLEEKESEKALNDNDKENEGLVVLAKQTFR